MRAKFRREMFPPGFCLRTSLGELTELPRPLAGLRGPTSKGNGTGGRGEREMGREGKGGTGPPFPNSWIRQDIERARRARGQKVMVRDEEMVK